LFLRAEDSDIVASSAPSGPGDRPGKGDHGAMRHLVNLLAVEDYTNKYKVRVVVRFCAAL
jgi:hypothetical protein